MQSTNWLLKASESDSYNKNDMKEKVNDLVRLHKAMQEKFIKFRTFQHQIQNKSKSLLLYIINGLKCTLQNVLMSLNTLFELHMKLKK